MNVEEQALAMARAELISKEGRKNTAYLDTRGILTVGIGHRVVATDGIKLGQTISDSRVDDFFASDVGKAFSSAKTQAIELDRYTPSMIAALISVNFQLGTGWRQKFPNTWSLLKSGKYEKAIANLYSSAWYDQTPNRVVAFVQAIQANYA
jgi:GH24 family phage-related lysozyme (muramidase)